MQIDILGTLQDLVNESGLNLLLQSPLNLVMIAVACFLMYLAIVKKFEPLLLLPIAFGMLCTNLPGAEMYHEILFAGGHVHWDWFGGAEITAEALMELQGEKGLKRIVKERRKKLSFLENLKRIIKSTLKHLPQSVYLKIKTKLR